jgi:hypothetical protein
MVRRRFRLTPCPPLFKKARREKTERQDELDL